MNRLMRTAAALVLAVPACAACLGSADYRMDVKLDAAARTLTGTQEIRWVNESPRTAGELQFHLYYNAFKDENSSFLNSNRMRTRDFSDWREDEWGSIELKLLVVKARDGSVEYDLTDFLEFVRNDDGNPLDETVVEAPLPEPVQPGQTLEILTEFEVKVPRTFARTGFRGDYFFLAHWFPKLGVLEDEGWNTHQFIQTEFYSEFGDYDVSLTVPAGWVVGATGTAEAAADNGDGTVTHRFRQERVHEFAWTTSPRFREYFEDFTHPTLRPVRMRLLLMPEHEGQQRRYFDATAAALRYYGEWFGEYPYDHVTVVDPAYRSGTGGMEYPTLFTGGTRWLQPQGSGDPEGVTIHEYGHQIWYGVVANNEFEDAWLDEGFNSYSTRRVKLEAFGRDQLVRRYLDGFLPYLFPEIEVAERTASGLGGPFSALKWDQMDVPSWRYGPAPVRGAAPPPQRRSRVYGPGAYSINSYTKPALMLQTLEGYLGWDVFQQVLSTYFERWKFRHPAPEDFFAVADEVSGQELEWFWDQTYRSSHVFDYAVDGVVERAGGGQRVLLRRWGEGIFPLEVRIEFADGRAVTERWDGRARWTYYDFFTGEDDPVIAVYLDPEGKLALDVNETNDSWVREAPARQAARKWSLKWMIWLQHTMQWFAFYG